MNDESLSAQHELLGTAVTKLIAEHAAALDSLPVNSGATPDELKRLFSEPLPFEGTPAAEILQQFAREVAPHAQQVPSPHYFGQFNPTPLAIGVWADALCSSLNQNAGAWRNGPTSAMVESQTIRWLCELIGYGSAAFGVLASGGSEANLIALKCARDRAGNGNGAVARPSGRTRTIANQGLRELDRELTFYTSEQCHFSVEKSLDILGHGRESLRKVQTDERFHVRVDALRAAIKEDLDAGRRPWCIVGVAGTTSTGVIDPLPELAEVAKENNCWFHVDAAYGGALAFSDKHKEKLRGIESADSITFDPHKWMFVPFACATTLVRNGGSVLRNSFDMSPEYLSEERGFSDAEYDFFRYGQMGTRRFNALKLWMCFKFMGKRGYSETVERHIELTQYFAAELDALPDFERVGEIETAVCCFRYLPESVRAMAANDQDQVQSSLQQRIERSGKAFFASTVLHGRRALRVNVNSYLTERRHIDDLIELLKSEAPSAIRG